MKYHGTGNDFIIIDARNMDTRPLNKNIIQKLCNRRFGIGSDGLILLIEHPAIDFLMKYFNSDGKEGSMCGNAGRCIVAFARKLGIIDTSAQFESIDGIHTATVEKSGHIKLQIQPVTSVIQKDDCYLLNTGSPHYVKFVDNAENEDVITNGKTIRFSTEFSQRGINVNFVSFERDGLFVRTYERGVEDETLSCGTGVVASAICAALKMESDKNSFHVSTRGGDLKVSFTRKDKTKFENIFLEGPVAFVYEGKIEI